VNAIDLLKEDHKVVSNLFDQVRSTPDSKHFALFKKIKAELDTHAHIEETVFYPRLKKDGKQDLVDITLEGIEEHRQVKLFLTEMGRMRRGGDEFEAKLKVVMEDVEHHVEEEENEMFPLVEDQFSDAVLKRLGISLLNRKQKFVQANPDVAKNLANRPRMMKTGMLTSIYETAVTAVEGMLGMANGKNKGTASKTSSSAAGKGKAKAAKSSSNGSASAKKGASSRTANKNSKAPAAKGHSAGGRGRSASK